MQQLQEIWDSVEDSILDYQGASLVVLVVYMTVAGGLSVYVRILFRFCSTSPSDSDSISRVFPLLAIVTTGVIAVVKSSLALSLGLVGALSIVRFRAAIKDPEELVYLFLCIAIGLAMGAEQPALALALVAVASVFILGMYYTSRGSQRQRLLLTITGDADTHFRNDDQGVIPIVESLAGKYSLQRFDVENGRGQLRVVLGESNPQKNAGLVSQLRERLPDCDLSYVDLNSLL